MMALLLALQLQAATPVAARPRAATDDRWFGADKVKHAILGGFLQAVGYAGLRSLGVRHGDAQAGAFVVVIGLAVQKERIDRRAYGHFSVRDVLWGAAGALATAAALSRTAR
jgi:uncharacterized protein YfiM (DUF2279 family)